MYRNKKIQLLEFKINNSYYALKIDQVKEIVVDVEKQQVLNSFNFINGIFKYRDEIYTALDMELIFESDIVYEKEIYLLTYNEKNINIALRLNEIVSIHELNSDDIETPDLIDTASENLFINGIVNLKENHLIQIIDINKLIEFIETLKDIKIEEKKGE
ncbi:chemotaxis protein CheW [Fusobacterium sp. IOR10]|uniref:chemotaxis protein CheW n=1 Tax=Fusobacterium sp. IOR10 TaxID=2665157 RepID=UPI0013D15E47|nr:chemotaxis protein CheW [Fusobacterium sp. IOR10]